MSPLKIILILAALALLVSCVAFFSSSETAFLSLTKIKLRRMVQEKKPNARLVVKLKKDMDNVLTTVLIGTNFVNSLASALATVLAVEIAGDGALGVSTLVISFFITVFGQIVPKTLAGQNPEARASKAALPIFTLKKVFFPIVWLFTRISHFAVFLAEKLLKPVQTGITPEEIQTLIQVGEKEGTLEKRESLMLKRISSFSDVTVNDIMHHRSMVSMVVETASLSEVMEEFLSSGYSNIAVYKETMEDVTGVLNYQDVLFSSREEDENAPDFAKKMMKPVLFVPGTFDLSELLDVFYKENKSFAVALDEAGGVQGVVTMTDIMKVVFGRMSDDFVHEEIPAENRIKVISPKEFIIPGDLSIEDVNNLLHMNLESDYYNTLGGWVLEQFGSLPSVGQVLIHKKNLFIVDEQVNRRIKLVKIILAN
ncbi:MAG: hemolysin family protein [Treponema sp.]|nr:hemolysin family protein [Treponema sp.]